eukprot:Clim_evm12s226 gene=Clim_evmTU12s226
MACETGLDTSPQGSNGNLQAMASFTQPTLAEQPMYTTYPQGNGRGPQIVGPQVTEGENGMGEQSTAGGTYMMPSYNGMPQPGQVMHPNTYGSSGNSDSNSLYMNPFQQQFQQQPYQQQMLTMGQHAVQSHQHHQQNPSTQYHHQGQQMYYHTPGGLIMHPGFTILNMSMHGQNMPQGQFPGVQDGNGNNPQIISFVNAQYPLHHQNNAAGNATYMPHHQQSQQQPQPLSTGAIPSDQDAYVVNCGNPMIVNSQGPTLQQQPSANRRPDVSSSGSASNGNASMSSVGGGGRKKTANSSQIFCGWIGCSGPEFKNVQELRDHIRDHHVVPGDYVCHWEGCQKTKKKFNIRQQLMRHIQTHVGNKNYACNYGDCGQRFSQASILAAHIRSHTGEKPYKCPYNCGKRFAHSNCLTAHIHSHTGIKPYVCKVCKKSLSGASNLITHMRVHTGEKPHKCEYPGCNKSFVTSGDLVRHVRIHIGEKPFHCEHAGCGKRFVTSTQLKSHARTHTGERPFKCQYEGCGKAYTDLTTLSRHRKKHEKQEEDAKTKGQQSLLTRSSATVSNTGVVANSEADNGCASMNGSSVASTVQNNSTGAESSVEGNDLAKQDSVTDNASSSSSRDKS